MSPRLRLLVLLACASACGPVPRGSSPRARPRRSSSPAVRILQAIPPLERCPPPERKRPARWFYDIARQMKRARDAMAWGALRARRIKDVLLFACLRAKARVATQIMQLTAAELPALRAQTPPDPLVTRRVLAYCTQVRELALAARRCVVPPPSTPRP